MKHLINNELALQLLDNHPESVVYYTPIFDRNTENEKIIDFEIVYCNRQTALLTGVPVEKLIGQRILSMVGTDKEQSNAIFQQLLQVYTSGELVEENYYVPTLFAHLNALRSKVGDGVLTVVRNKTSDIVRQEKELQQVSLMNSILDASINGVFAMEAVRNDLGEVVDLRIVKINKAYTKLIGKTAEEVEGKCYLHLFPDSKKEGTFGLNCQVIETGKPVRTEMYYKGDGLDAWYDISLVKWGDGLVVTFSDITERKKAELENDQNNQLIKTMLDSSFHGKALLQPVKDEAGDIVDFTVLAANRASESQIGIKSERAVGQLVSAILPGYKKDGFFQLFKAAIETGEPQQGELFYKDENFEAWFEMYVARVHKGVVVSFSNITERKMETLLIQQQKSLLDAILSHSPSGISVTEIINDEQGNILLDARTIVANDAALRYLGFDHEGVLTKTAKEMDPEIFESPLFQLASDTLKTGEPFHTQFYFNPTQRWLELSVAKMDDTHLINVFTDVTSTKEIQLQVEHFAERLQKVINTAQSPMALVKPMTNEKGEVNDFVFEIVNTAWAGYAGQTAEIMIGHPVSKWFPAYLTNSLFDQYKTTYDTGETTRREFHYNDDNLDAWLDIMTTRLEDGVLVSVTDFTDIKKLQLKLEKSVIELRQSNASLEEFAYAASHDLQEPLRKIRFHSDKLKHKFIDKLGEDGETTLQRIEDSASRMSRLIEDLLAYSQMTDARISYSKVDLNELLNEVCSDLDTVIQEKQAYIQKDKLPTLLGDKSQLRQVFHNLFSNALKYSKPTEAPFVEIKYSLQNRPIVNGVAINDSPPYHVIEVSDKGIGFEQQYADEIFKIFQRLHSQKEFPGNGVGLAMVQKGMHNHGGKIVVKAEPGKGATFTLLFPVHQLSRYNDATN